MSTGRVVRCVLIAAVAGVGVAAAAQGAVLTHVGISVTGTGGSGSGTSASDMVFAEYGSNGWGWAGGAAGVQGTGATTATGPAAAANEALRFNVGAVADSLNATFGAGAWTIANPVLSFATSSKTQFNPLFGVGSGTFDIYWVGNDNWAQSKGTATDKERNPIYANNAADLLTWSGSQSLLGSGTFTAVPGNTDIVTLTFGLSDTSPFVNDVVTASAASGSNSGASLYLMGTSDSLGMIIYTGGQGAALPLLSFDVVSVPEPGMAGLLVAAATVAGVRRRQTRRA